MAEIGVFRMGGDKIYTHEDCAKIESPEFGAPYKAFQLPNGKTMGDVKRLCLFGYHWESSGTAWLNGIYKDANGTYYTVYKSGTQIVTGTKSVSDNQRYLPTLNASYNDGTTKGSFAMFTFK